MGISVISLFQARCDNRQIGTRSSVDPIQWIEAAIPDTVTNYSFHFLVKWTADPCELTGPLLLTRLVTASNPDKLQTASNDEVLEAFCGTGGEHHLRELTCLAALAATPAVGVLLGEMEVALLDADSPAWLVDLGGVPECPLRIERITLADLSERISRHRGGPASLGLKGLTFGTSAVECWLSRTRNLYPGDCDCLLTENGRPICVLEMKKHTLSEPIGNRLASRYYPSPDGRKYDSLLALQRRFGAECGWELPLAVVYYATRFRGFRIQVLQRRGMSLYALKDSGDQDCTRLGAKEIGQRILDEVLT